MGCHKAEADAWEKSDHAMAMALPSANTVLGQFDGTNIELNGQQIQFYTKDAAFFAKVTDHGTTQSEIFKIQYTFGHYPLQQYLVETHVGTYQVLPIVWDSRDKAEGGQRWYHIYENENITPIDRLHWRQPLQNWNGMCADCHSDELKRNYQEATNSFNTTFSGINVGCVSCHGAMDGHDKAGKEKPLSDSTKESLKLTTPNNNEHWQYSEHLDTAIWSGPKRDNHFMQTCFACHSLRASLTDGFSADVDFLDQFSPTLVNPPFYYTDGQIKEEVYVYGSFLQSKMYKKGVNCLDCHDKHTMKIKVEGNGLCLQCHKATTFNTPKHHKHKHSNEAAQCVNCHMPDTIYMGTDNRRDHSFKIPRPDLSVKYETPNACMDCHQKNGNAWAAKQLESWYGKPKDKGKNYQTLLDLRHGIAIPLSSHLAIISDDSLSIIDRASALELLPMYHTNLRVEDLEHWLSHEEDLIRLTAVKVSRVLQPRDRMKILIKSLSDNVRAIRIASAEALLNIPAMQKNLDVFNKAFDELSQAYHSTAWRGEGRLNQGNSAMANNDLSSAETAFKTSTKIDPYFAPSFENLADLYRIQKREDLVANTLKLGMKNNPDSPSLAYSTGLHLVRIKQIPHAIEYFKTAMTLDNYNPQYPYTYILAIDGNKQGVKALILLKDLVTKYQDNSNLIKLGLHLSQKNKDQNSFQFFLNLRNL